MLIIYLIALVSFLSSFALDNGNFLNVGVADTLSAHHAQVDTDLFVGGNAEISGDLTIHGILHNVANGNIQGPVISTVNAVARWANTSGTALKDSPVLIDDAGNVTLSGITKDSNTVSWPATGGAAIVNPVTTLAAGTNPTASADGASVTYLYYAATNSWYRIGRG